MILLKNILHLEKTEAVIQMILESTALLEEGTPRYIKYSTDYTVLILTKEEKRNLLAQERGELNI